MSDKPESPWIPVEEPTPVSATSNKLGIAGFIVSLVGPCTCGVLSPVGLVMSVIALFRFPRGFAIAGTVLGVLGSLLLLIVGFGVVQVSDATGISWSKLATFSQTSNQMIGATQPIDSYHQQNDALPDDQEGQALIDGMTDVWGTQLRYRRVEPDRYEILSAGPDAQFDTDDDLAMKSFPGQWSQAASQLPPAPGDSQAPPDAEPATPQTQPAPPAPEPSTS